MTYTVYIRQQPVRFESNLTDRQALEICRPLPSDFAKSLVSKFETLTNNQLAWLHKLAIDSGTPAQPRESFTANLPLLFSLFHKASNHGGLKRPALTFRNGQTIRIKLAGPGSRYSGSLLVTNGEPFGSTSGKFFGHIKEGGVFVSGRDCNAAVIELLESLDENPAKAASEYGRLTGHCCFCDRQLTDERSTSVGYGPICADKWQLPWGGIAPSAQFELLAV